MLLFQERYYSALNVGQSKVSRRVGAPDTWMGVWSSPQNVVAILGNPINAPSLKVEMLKATATQNAVIADADQWKQLPDIAPSGAVSVTRIESGFASLAVRLTAGPRAPTGSAYGDVIPLVNLGDIAEVPTLETPPPPFRLEYNMPMDGFVAIAISDKKTSKLVRRLVAEVPRDKGPVSEPWDLKDDNGQLVMPGEYTWKVLARPPLKLTYQMTVNNAGQPAWWAPAPGKGGGGWLADHTPPSSACAVGNLIFLGAPVAESGQSSIAVDLEGNKVWGQTLAGFDGTTRLAGNGKVCFVLHPNYVKEVDPSHDFAVRNVYTPKFSRDLPMTPISGAAALGDKLYISYGAPNASWLVPSFTSNDMNPDNSLPRIWLRKGNGGRSGQNDRNYGLDEYDELMQFYGAFLTDQMPDLSPSYPDGPVPSSDQAYFGDSPANGPLGGMVTAVFKKPVTIGSVMVPDAKIRVYALKPGAAMPADTPGGGDPDAVLEGNPDTGEKFNEDDWIQLPVSGAPGKPGIGLAPPGGLQTQALRFSCTRLIWGLAMGRRFADVAPQAERIIEEGQETPHGGWSVERPSSTPITEYTPAMMGLQWNTSVSIRGVSLTYPVASTTYVDYWVGPDSKSPKASLHDDTCWKQAGIIQPVQFSWSGQLGTTRQVDFGDVIKTRGIRVRATEPAGYRNPPYGLKPVTGPHKAGFDAIVAYSPLGDDPTMPLQYGPRITEYKIPSIDDKDGQLTVLRQLPLVGAGNIAFSKQGVLYAFSGDKIVTVPLDSETTRRVVVDSGHIEKPGDLTVDADGLIYASDLGAKDIKVFDPKTGALVRTIGKPGGQHVGPWDPLRFDSPQGLTIDSAGKLWVCDSTYQPKRVERLTRDGAVEKWFLGPTTYGGGGWLDSGNKSVLNYNGMKFVLDWPTYTWKLQSIMYRPGDPLSSGGAMPDRPVYLGGHRYLVGPDIGPGGMDGGIGTVCVERNDIAVPMAAMGSLTDWADVQLRPDLRAKFGTMQAGDYTFLWCDKNGDGIPEADEVQVIPGSLGAANVGEDLSFNFDGYRLRPTSIGANGIPQYDISKLEKLSNFDGTKWVTSDGRTFVKGVPDRLYAADGKTVLWQYPNPYNVHGGYYATGFGPNRPPGVLNQEHFPIGHFALNDAQGNPEEYFVTNSDEGDWFCYSGDGLLVGCLLGGAEGYGLRQWTMPEWTPGKVDLSDMRPGQEHYHGCAVKADDGKVYLVAGHNHVSIVRVDGLEQVQRVAGDCTVTQESIAKTQAWDVVRAEHARMAQEPKVAKMPFIDKDLSISGSLDNWPDDMFVDVNSFWRHGLYHNDFIIHSQGALAYNKEKLYVVGWSLDASVRNSAEDPKMMFKYGEALEVTLGMDPSADPKRTSPVNGDLRILITQLKDGPVAVVYRPVDPDAPASKHMVFNSPVGETRMDFVEVIPDADIKITADTLTQTTGSPETRWIIEAAIPWASLGVKAPTVGTHIRGDIGILQSDQNGVRTVNRLYWSGKSQTIVSDLPSEARLTPALWGDFYCSEPEETQKFGPEDVDIAP